MLVVNNQDIIGLEYDVWECWFVNFMLYNCFLILVCRLLVVQKLVLFCFKLNLGIVGCLGFVKYDLCNVME